MKKIIIPFFIFLLAVNGCGTIYSTAVDERNVSTIANDTTIKGEIVKKFYDDDDKIKSLDISTGCYRGHVYLVGDKDIWSTNIDIKSIRCRVVLYGLVGSKKEINKAIAHAKSVEGIRGVKSFLKSENE